MEEEIGGPLLGGTPDRDGVTKRAMRRIQSGELPRMDLSTFSAESLKFQLNLNLIATLKGWGLGLHRQTPDTAAIGRLLDIRYRNSTDDIQHEDLFGWQGKVDEERGEQAEASPIGLAG